MKHSKTETIKKNAPHVPALAHSIKDLAKHMGDSSHQFGQLILSEIQELKSEVLNQWHHMKVSEKLNHFLEENKKEHSHYQRLHALELSLAKQYAILTDLVIELGEHTGELLQKKEIAHPVLKPIYARLTKQKSLIKKMTREKEQLESSPKV